VVLAASAYLVARNRDVIADTLADIGWEAMVAAGAVGILGTLAVGGAWLALLRGTDSVRVPTVDGLCTFYVTQLGKYVPGAVWPIVAQVAASRRWGVRRSSVVIANLVMLLQLALTGVLLGLLLLPWVADLGRPWLAWGSLCAPILLLLLHPRVIPALSRRFRIPLGGGSRLELDIRPDAVLQGDAWSVSTWGLFGGQLWVLLHAAGAEGSATYWAAVGGAGLAWAAGLVAIFAPAGAGVREAVLVAVCAPLVGAGPALAVALASRILLTLADVVLALAGAGWHAATGDGRGSVPGPVQQ
jgi:glycosyltransferase 2 family protein